MKRDEKINMMKSKIIQSASEEFGKKGYELASVNDICKNAAISKGIIYHYFKDKDQLYLACIQECYQALYDFYLSGDKTFLLMGDVQLLMERRMDFFKKYPIFRGLFFQALLNTPQRLKKEVEDLNESIKQLHFEIYSNYLKKLKLRDNISIEQSIKYLDIIQNAYNDYFRKQIESNFDFEALIDEHEKSIPKWIDLMIYGIAKEEIK